MSTAPSMNEVVPKSFWERKEGWTGMIILGLIGFGLFSISPTILLLLQDTTYALMLLGGLAAVAYLAMNTQFRNMVWAAYQIFCRKVTGILIEMDPIAIVNGYIEKLEKNRENMAEQINKLRQQMGSLKRLIDTNEKSRVENIQLMQAAKGKNDTQFVLKSRAAGRLQDSNLNLQQLYTKLEVVYRVLNKMYENAGVILEDTKDDVKIRTTEYAAIKVSSNAFRSAMSVINGDKDKKAIFDQTMEFMADNIGQRVGEMEHFMDISKSFMDGIDLQNGVFEQSGLKMLENWEKQSTTLLLTGSEKKDLIASANDENSVVDLDEDRTVKVGHSGSGKKYV